MALAADIPTEFMGQLSPHKTRAESGPTSPGFSFQASRNFFSPGNQTARERRPVSCGYNYLRERKAELAQAAASRTSASPSALRGELILTPRLPPRKTPPVLASSIHRGAFWKAPPPLEKASHAYQWVPVHVRQMDPGCQGQHPVIALQEHSTGTYVNTLTMTLRKHTFDGAPAHVLRLDPMHFVPNTGKPWCYLLNGTSPFVVVRGVVTRVGQPRPKGEPAEPLMVARLPEGLRPKQPLRFAALARQAEDTGGHSSRLVSLTAFPSGEIVTEVGPGGRDEVMVGSSVDLSAIRFSTGKGISLIDDVSLHICDVAGTRIVGLQGTLTEKCFEIHGRKLVALLPESCRPPEQTDFVVCGTNGGFHLMRVRPNSTYAASGSGDLVWQDGKWNRDLIDMNGIMFEVAPDALGLPNPLEERTLTEGQAIAIMDFQKYLIRRFGTFQSAWDTAFDTDCSGEVNYTEFGIGCKHSGYVGNASRLWSVLDQDLSGAISLQELSMDAEALLADIRAKSLEAGRTFQLVSTRKPRRPSLMASVGVE